MSALQLACTALLMSSLPSLLLADEDGIPPMGSDLGPTLLQLVGAMLLIVAVIYASMWLMKRYTIGKTGNGGELIEIIERRHLSPKQALYVIRVGEQHLLIGVTEGGISKLSEVAYGKAESRLTTVAARADESKFGRLLRQAKESLMPLVAAKRKGAEA